MNRYDPVIYGDEAVVDDGPYVKWEDYERLRVALQKIACWDKPFAETEDGYASMAIVTAREATDDPSDAIMFPNALRRGDGR